MRAVSPSGVLGDPTLATIGEGRQLLAMLADQLTDALESWWAEVRRPARTGAEG